MHCDRSSDKRRVKRLFATAMLTAAAPALMLLYLHAIGRTDHPQDTTDKTIAPIALTARAAAAVRDININERIERDVTAGRPIVVHLIVALCDNKYQGIVPVPAELGDGSDARNNLYWGAMYGVRTFLTRKANWTLVSELPKLPEPVLEKIVLHTTIPRSGQQASVYLVAEAWEGKHIRPATERFLSIAAGREPETVQIKIGDTAKEIDTGGHAHLAAYIGHNGLMDFSLEKTPPANPDAAPSDAIVLACRSKPYFGPLLKKAGAHPVLITTALMAPEAYTFDAAVRAWSAGAEPEQVRERAAAAYNKYQKCGLSAARKLFYYQPQKREPQ